MNCPTCKNPINDNSTECEWCGAKINLSKGNVIDSSKRIKAYNLKTKEKNAAMYDAVIRKNKDGYMASGNDGKGNMIAAIIDEERALQAIADGVAIKAF